MADARLISAASTPIAKSKPKTELILALALAAGLGLGVGAGLMIGGVRHLHDVLNPFVVALYALPKILVLPWILLAFGLAATPAVVYGVLQGFFPVCLLVAGGVRDIDRGPLLVARSMGATSWQIYRKVVLPMVLPAVLAGMRLARPAVGGGA